MINNYKPIQKESIFKKDRTWKRQSLSYYNSFLNKDKKEINDFYRIASGKISEIDYTYVTNQYDLEGKDRKNPAKLLNFDILSPIFKKLLSEYRIRSFEPIVYCKNSDYENELMAIEKDSIVNSLQQRFINTLIKSGKFQPVDEQGNKVEEPESPDAINEKLLSYKDSKSINAQSILDYIIDEQCLEDKYVNQFYDLLVTNSCFSFKNVKNNKIVYYRVNPDSIVYGSGINMKYVEDSEFVKASYGFTFSEVLDIFQEEFKKEEFLKEYGDITDYLESIYRGDINTKLYSDLDNKNHVLNTNFKNLNSIDVSHIQWTSYKKVSYIYVDGQQILIDEYFDNQNLDTDFFWIEETREGYVINNYYFIGGDVIEYERRSSIDVYKSKKLYNGMVFMNDVISQKKLPELLAPYQETYNVLKYKLQSHINKSKGKIATIPIGLLANVYKESSLVNNDINNTFFNNGEVSVKNDEESYIAKALYYADSTQMLLIDETSPNALAALQGLRSIDLESGGVIALISNYADTIKSEAEELVGYNRFRQSQIKTSDSISNVQQGINSGEMVTEGYFDEFEKYIANDLQGIIDLSKYAFKDGFSTKFIRNNNEVVNLQVSSDYINSDIGIFISNSRKKKDLKNMMMQQATQFLQNGMQHSTWLKMMNGSQNMATIIENVEKAEMQLNQQRQQSEEANRQMQLQVAEIDKQNTDNTLSMKKYEIDTKAETELNKQLNNSIAFNLSMGKDDVAKELENTRYKMISDARKQQLELQKMDLDNLKNLRNDNARKYVADKQLEIAKVNK